MSTDSGNRKYQALALGTSYALGTFNDNFFKQAGLLLAVTTGNAVFQSQVTFLFALPFVLFSAWSGWPTVSPRKASSSARRHWNSRLCWRERGAW